jgi:tetratricopeptide (TPR) repeat protein
MMRNVARLYHGEGRSARAETLLNYVVHEQGSLLGSDHPDTLTSMSILARAYLDQGKYSKAEPLYLKVLEVRRRTLGPEHRDTTSILAALGEMRLRQQQYAEAEPLLRSALKGQAKNNPEAWERYATESMLGAALAAQARFPEAEPLLMSGYQRLIHKEGTIPWESRAALEDAGQRIVRLYQASGKSQKALQWRDKLQAAAQAPLP